MLVMMLDIWEFPGDSRVATYSGANFKLNFPKITFNFREIIPQAAKPLHAGQSGTWLPKLTSII